MVEEYVVREEDIDEMHNLDVRQGPTCRECGAKLEYQGGHFRLNTNGPLSHGTRFWKCPACGRRPHEPIAYNHAADRLLVNLQEGE